MVAVYNLIDILFWSSVGVTVLNFLKNSNRALNKNGKKIEIFNNFSSVKLKNEWSAHFLHKLFLSEKEESS